MEVEYMTEDESNRVKSYIVSKSNKYEPRNAVKQNKR